MGLRTALKRAERASRTACRLAIARLLGRSQPSALPDWGAGPHRVLFLRHDRIGDMILSTGVLRAIAGAHPTITLDVLASPVNAPVLAADPDVAEVLIVEPKRPWTLPLLVWRLRRARYDAVIDCMVTAPSLTTLLLMLGSGARHRIGVAARGNDSAYTLPVEPLDDATHIVEHLAALVAAFGLDPRATDVTPRIELTDDERASAEQHWLALCDGGSSERLLINVSSGKAARRWPDERFVAVLRRVRLRAPTIQPMLLGAPDEVERATRIAREGGATLVRTASIRDALALVASADRIFTPDTSIAHAASAFGKPAVVMYLDRKAALWGLYGAPGHSLESPDHTLASLQLEPVLRAVDALLDLDLAPDLPHAVASRM